MRLPAPLLRRNPRSYKNQYGHVLILAGSPGMLGAAALAGLAAMRAGAGLTTIGIPKSLNAPLQKKISPVIMTLPLKETPQQTLSPAAFLQLEPLLQKYQAIAIGPGLTGNPKTAAFVRKIVETASQPLVIDADALTIISRHLESLMVSDSPKVLTPHPGELARLTGLSKQKIASNRTAAAKNFAKTHRCVLVLKGHRTVVASPEGEIYFNTTGNPGMATAGSGDVLTGMIAALLSQGVEAFEAARTGVYWHGKAGDLAARQKTKAAMIATDIIENIPAALLKAVKRAT